MAEEKRFRVLLANVGNPDFRQDSERPLPGSRSGLWVKASSLREAAEICRTYIHDEDLGGGNWAGGEVQLRETNETVAEISYNGRAWKPGSIRGTVKREEISLDETFEATGPTP